ncbi:MAG: RNA polymerase sigma factor [Nitrospira sp.]|nr:RNA polymerase sigma factor [Nitrospira sp.]
MQEEQELVRRLKAGEEGAFVRIIELYRKPGINLAYRIMNDYQDAEDVSQEAFAALYKNIHSFRGESSLKTFFMSILINLARQRFRRKKLISFISLDRSHEGDEDKGEMDIQDNNTIEKEIIGKEIRRKINAALRSLPSRQREVFILRHYEDMNLAEIAEVTGCSTGTVKSHLFRAIESLRKRLRGLWNEMQ